MNWRETIKAFGAVDRQKETFTQLIIDFKTFQIPVPYVYGTRT